MSSHAVRQSHIGARRYQVRTSLGGRSRRIARSAVWSERRDIDGRLGGKSAATSLSNESGDDQVRDARIRRGMSFPANSGHPLITPFPGPDHDDDAEPPRLH